ncbi:hypothetical protein HBI38_104890 [Parastagonospora nodorum]|nr:hypothetical protein HBH49_069440 [Parastagonospora nodorum]KAH4066248.1 hypothetical protein HBH50_146630 [Parastagonospora nodorum]KAH4089329.1 hypothetical protein HBH48_111730 [Parastagonospora nodorum]KAH4212400.1 hypothetical protein HBI95_036850 [Parastagonospora nodorum]KAH4610342.1 hypothetical protein HBH82_050530 [Parastagonospora nodorum]
MTENSRRYPNPQPSTGGQASNENPTSKADDKAPERLPDAKRQHEHRTTKAESRLRKTLSKRNRNVRALTQRLQEARRENQNVQTEVRDWIQKHEVISGLYEWIHEGYGFIIERLIKPYADRRNMRFSDSTFESINAVLVPLLHDALQTKSIRNELQTSQSQVQDAHDMMRTLKLDLQESQNKVQGLQEKLHSASKVQTMREDTRNTQCEAQRLNGALELVKGQLRTAQDDLITTKTLLRRSEDQVEALQKDMLSRVDRVKAVSDERLAQDFRAIVSLVRTLSRSIRPLKDASIFDVLHARTMLNDVHVSQWNTRARMKCYIEAWIWSVLIELVFCGPFAIFQTVGITLNQNWAYLFRNTSISDWPAPSAPCESWRCLTMQRLVDDVGEDAIKNGHSATMHRDSEGLESAVIEGRSKVANIIGEGLMQISSTADFSRISFIIDKAYSLALQMSLQRCRLQITFPAVGSDFIEAEMFPVTDPDGDEVNTGSVAFIVQPGLTKWGDAHGRNFDERYDIVPALVQLESVGIEEQEL